MSVCSLFQCSSSAQRSVQLKFNCIEIDECFNSIKLFYYQLLTSQFMCVRMCVCHSINAERVVTPHVEIFLYVWFFWLMMMRARRSDRQTKNMEREYGAIILGFWVGEWCVVRNGLCLI